MDIARASMSSFQGYWLGSKWLCDALDICIDNMYLQHCCSMCSNPFAVFAHSRLQIALSIANGVFSVRCSAPQSFVSLVIAFAVCTLAFAPWRLDYYQLYAFGCPRQDLHCWGPPLAVNGK